MAAGTDVNGLRDLDGSGMTSLRTRRRLVERLRQRGISNPRVLEAIGSIPRHLFVDEALATRAYEDTALPIGHQQTISQPYVVARMTEILLDGNVEMDSVLEIGTGSGYQTAVLSRLAKTVCTIERIGGLQRGAKSLLYDLRCRNIHYLHGDGADGWNEHAPFQGILLTAACEDIPVALAAQLANGGRLVAPAGAGLQRITIVERRNGRLERRTADEVSFVPMQRGTA